MKSRLTIALQTARLSAHLSAVAAATLGGLPAGAADEVFTFAVVGHVRGNADGEMSPRIDELVARLRELQPDLVFLTGDMIWGMVDAPTADAAVVTADWERLDEKLALVGVPVHRVPGNHDINDPVTRDIYFDRYGRLPHSFAVGRSLFILLNTTYVPADGEPLRKFIRTARLDSAQVDFVRSAVQAGPYEHVFLFMHHVLWWEADAPWWQDVHPLLVGRGGRAVFSGDLGPTRFTHLERDGVDYVRSLIDTALEVSVRSRDELIDACMAQQFENFLFIRVDGERVQIDVETIGELSSNRFTPTSWEETFGPIQEDDRWIYDPADQEREPASWAQRLRGLRGRRLAILTTLAAMAFLAGLIAGLAAASRKKAA